MLCDYLQGCDGVGGGTEVQEEGDICILTAGPHCCMVETKVTL